MQCRVISVLIMRRPTRQRRSTRTMSTAAMIAATANKDDDECGDDEGGGLSTGVIAMDVDRESLASFLTDSGTTIIEEESDSEEEEEEDWDASESAQFTMMRDNARPIRTTKERERFGMVLNVLIGRTEERVCGSPFFVLHLEH